MKARNKELFYILKFKKQNYKREIYDGFKFFQHNFQAWKVNRQKMKYLSNGTTIL